jgi:methanethiol S-methyltransferase
VKRLIAVTYGTLVYVLFLGTLLYAVCFVGNIVVPKRIDTGPVTPIAEAILINALLLGLFTVQHSVMARQGFKRWWTRIVPPPVERSTFVLAASALLALVMWQWRPIAGTIWDLRGSAAEPVLFALFWIGWAILLMSTFLLNHFELFGLQQPWKYLLGRENHRPTFKTPSLYRFVRHPLYLGFLIAFWSTPFMSAGHLLFSIATTGYILLGIWFEERDLTAVYGETYRRYRKQVPMLIPFLGNSEKKEAAPAVGEQSQLRERP